PRPPPCPPLSPYTTLFRSRRPWLIAGILTLAFGSGIVALADSVAVLIVGWVVVSLAGAANAAAITPIVAERVPESQRGTVGAIRSEEHTSELQSRENLVCR